MNKDELLKIYSAYLPYKLNVISMRSGVMYELSTFNEMKGRGVEKRDLQMVLSGDFKPIFYDLSCLTKEIEHEGKKVMPYKLLFEQDLPWDAEDAILNEALSFINNEKRLEYSYPYEFWQKLLSMHFNVFNLPEDQFINKATLTQKQ